MTVRQLLQNILGYSMLLAGFFLLSESSQRSQAGTWKEIYVLSVDTRVNPGQNSETTTVIYENLPSRKRDQLSFSCQFDVTDPLGCRGLQDPYTVLLHKRACVKFATPIILDSQPECPKKSDSALMFWGGILLVLFGFMLAGLNSWTRWLRWL
jgi:hypothetical protein